MSEKRDVKNEGANSGQQSRESKSSTAKLDPNKREESKIQRKEIHEHIKGRGLVSNVVLGLSDGLITNIAFLAGFGGAVSEIVIIRLAGLAVMLAGSVSMFFGGLVAGQSQHDLYMADATRELNEIENEPEEEKEELRTLYLEKGLTSQEADIVVRRITSDKRKWLEDLLTQELHIHESALESPIEVALITGLSFLAGAFVPLAPYLLTGTKETALISSIMLSLAFLFAAGFWKGLLLGRRKWTSAFQMLGIGAVASAILYIIGTLLHMFV